MHGTGYAIGGQDRRTGQEDRTGDRTGDRGQEQRKGPASNRQRGLLNSRPA